jgi:hypothetical protein
VAVISRAFGIYIGGALSLFESLPPILTLAGIGFVVGIGMLWVFSRVSDQAKIVRTKKVLYAHLYELRLFGDEPRLIWRAQKGLLLGNLRYLGLMLRPAVILSIPMIFLLVQLEAFYGRELLPLGKPAIVTVQMSGPLDKHTAPPNLEAPAGIDVETLPVRILEQGQISWRIRPRQAISGDLRLVFPNGVYDKTVASGLGTRYLSERRVSSVFDLLLYPSEKCLPGGLVNWIEVRYPAAEVQFLGFRFHWLVWFLLFSMATALALKGRFGVSL